LASELSIKKIVRLPNEVAQKELAIGGAIWRVRQRHFAFSLDSRFDPQSGGSAVADTNGRRLSAAKILCVEPDPTVRESRCAVLKVSGYDTASATPLLAETVLRSQKFDLLVLSTLNDYGQNRLINLADGADVLVLERLTMPLELLWLVAERLNRQQRA
jgi:hypothetical protein